ncbi:ATP-binding protein [Alistipes putredinis]|uniref:ATP-binding protein n=1 Tax=Alistipes putredinis TaxID=28117 RepID=UPI0036F38110
MEIQTIDDIKNLIKSDTETDTIEFKKTTGQLERGMETLCAFLNGDGGTVLFGVTDEGKIIGQDIAGKTKETIGEAISRIEPNVNVRIFYVPMPDSEKKVIALHVESSRMERPFCYKGRPYMRFQNVTTVMPQDKYRQLLMERGGNYSWEAMTNPDLKISDLDEHAILGAVRGGIRCGRLPEATIREDLPTILEKFNLSHDGKLNNASAVLFGRDLYYYPQCLLRMARFKGTTKNEFIDNQRVIGNIYALLDAAMAFFFKHLSLSGKIEGLYREEELEIPYKALRECCTNAFCHRLYHRPGSSVGIAIYDDRVEIENSGTFPPNITMEKLLSGHNSEPQNLIIANVLYKSEVLENWGRGIELMISECRRVNIPDPEFHTDGNSVWVIFRYTRKTMEYDPTATRQLPDSCPTATPQVEKVLHAIKEQTLSTKEIMGMLGLKDKSNFLELYLYPATRQNLVEPIYPDNPKHPRQKYRLTEKGINLIKNN